MATSIPIDVVRDVKNMVAEMRSRSDILEQDAHEKMVRADVLQKEAMYLEMLYDNWLKQFPDTGVP